MKKIEVNKISKSFKKGLKKIAVFNDLSVTFEVGKFYVIIGKSGAGKTTLLKCISGLCKIDSGNILFDNKDIFKLNDKDLSLLRSKEIGFIFQDYNLLEFLNAYENIAMPLLISQGVNFKDKEVIDKVENELKFVELEDRKDHYPNESSGGEQQRIAIARALINNPSLILADEPTGNLDKQNSEKVLKLLKKISKDRCVIVVTHDEAVLKYADIVYNFEDGLKIYKDKKI